MSKKESLQIVSVEFRDLVSAAMKPEFERLPRCMSRLLEFVDETPLLADAVEASPPPAEGSASADIEALSNDRRVRIVPPDDRRSDLRYAYDVVRALAKMDPDDLMRTSVFYGRSSKATQGAPKLLADTVGALATELQRVITAALLEEEQRSAKGIEVRADGGGTAQVVVHQGQGDISARMSAVTRGVDLVDALEELRRLASEDHIPNPAVAAEVRDIADAAEAESKKERPNRFTLAAINERLLELKVAYEVLEGPAGVVSNWIAALLELPK